MNGPIVAWANGDVSPDEMVARHTERKTREAADELRSRLDNQGKLELDALMSAWENRKTLPSLEEMEDHEKDIPMRCTPPNTEISG